MHLGTLNTSIKEAALSGFLIGIFMGSHNAGTQNLF